MYLHQNLKTLRLRQGITQGQMASRLGIKRVTYSKWEELESTPKLPTIINISKKFKLTLDQLVLTEL